MIKRQFYDELEQFFYHHWIILLGDFNAKVGREDIFKPTIRMRVYIMVVMLMVLV